MGIWNINPNDTASIDPNTGKAIFQPNDSYSEKHFTITYTEGDIKCVTTVTQNGNPCSYVYDKNNDNIPASGDDEYVFGTLSNVDGQEISVMVTNGSEFIDGGKITVENDRLIASIYKNTDNESRDIEYKIYADGNVCGDGYSNTQDSNDCECRNLTLSPDSLSWEWERGEEPQQVVSMDYPNCITGIEQISTLSHFTAIMDTDSITIYPNEDNTSTTVYNDTLTIRYNAGTIEGCTQDISLTQGINGCNCPDLRFKDDITSLEWEWNDENWKTVELIYTCSDQESITLSEPTNFEVSLSEEKNEISIKPNGENEYVEPLTDTLTVSYRSGFHDCEKTIDLTQAGNACNCNSIEYSSDDSIIPRDAEEAVIGTFTMKYGCDPNLVDIAISTSDDPHGITKDSAYIEAGNPNRIIVDVNPYSQSVEDLSFTYHIQYNGDNCYDGTKTQEAGIVCSCETITFNQAEFDDRFFSTRGAENAFLGTLDIPNQKCMDYVEIVGDDGLTIREIENNEVRADISQYDFDENYNGRVLEFTLLVNNNPCGTYQIYQQAFRGTDNGVDSYADGTELNYPIFLLGDIDDRVCSDSRYDAHCHHKESCSDCVYCDEGCSVHGSYQDDDSIVCEGGAYYEGTLINDGWSGADVNWNTGDGVCHIDSPDYSDGICHVGMIRVSATTTWTPTITETIDAAHPMTLGEAINKGYIRIASFFLTTEPGAGVKPILKPSAGETCPICVCDYNLAHAGEDCAKKWRYEVWQLPKGYYVCFDEDGHPYEYNLYPLSMQCNKDRQMGECRCKERQEGE